MDASHDGRVCLPISVVVDSTPRVVQPPWRTVHTERVTRIGFFTQPAPEEIGSELSLLASPRPDEQVRVAQIARRLRRLCGDGTRMENPSAMLVVFITNYIIRSRWLRGKLPISLAYSCGLDPDWSR
ncbi:hypothetical protein TNCV_4968891 [Trichonephila clavipes]|nr:hypothetical protein TNCV_4968891 [Trichonephila clavipes]